ncbi:MAG TPA: helix-turn-helix domain-containing protein, partial [Gemmatimonadaceae bacterium]
EYGLPAMELTTAAVRALRERRWPGNVRELRNAIERAVVLATGPTVDAIEVSETIAPDVPSGELPFPATIAEVNRAAARRMLELSGGNKTDAARRLGISRPRLHRLLNLSPGPDDPDDEDTSDV